jgi:hypothetical protein
VADLTPDRLARLRVWAQRGNPDSADDAGSDGCPWCEGPNGPDGNAHDLALELLDEIDRLRKIAAAAEAYRAETENPAPDLLMRAQRRTELFDVLATWDPR